jgi:hypothetical protein
MRAKFPSLTEKEPKQNRTKKSNFLGQLTFSATGILRWGVLCYARARDVQRGQQPLETIIVL